MTQQHERLIAGGTAVMKMKGRENPSRLTSQRSKPKESSPIFDLDCFDDDASSISMSCSSSISSSSSSCSSLSTLSDSVGVIRRKPKPSAATKVLPLRTGAKKTVDGGFDIDIDKIEDDIKAADVTTERFQKYLASKTASNLKLTPKYGQKSNVRRYVEGSAMDLPPSPHKSSSCRTRKIDLKEERKSPTSTNTRERVRMLKRTSTPVGLPVCKIERGVRNAKRDKTRSSSSSSKKKQEESNKQQLAPLSPHHDGHHKVCSNYELGNKINGGGKTKKSEATGSTTVASTLSTTNNQNNNTITMFSQSGPSSMWGEHPFAAEDFALYNGGGEKQCSSSNVENDNLFEEFGYEHATPERSPVAGRKIPIRRSSITMKPAAPTRRQSIASKTCVSDLEDEEPADNKKNKSLGVSPQTKPKQGRRFSMPTVTPATEDTFTKKSPKREDDVFIFVPSPEPSPSSCSKRKRSSRRLSAPSTLPFEEPDAHLSSSKAQESIRKSNDVSADHSGTPRCLLPSAKDSSHRRQGRRTSTSNSAKLSPKPSKAKATDAEKSVEKKQLKSSSPKRPQQLQHGKPSSPDRRREKSRCHRHQRSSSVPKLMATTMPTTPLLSTEPVRVSSAAPLMIRTGRRKSIAYKPGEGKFVPDESHTLVDYTCDSPLPVQHCRRQRRLSIPTAQSSTGFPEDPFQSSAVAGIVQHVTSRRTGKTNRRASLCS